MGEYRHAGHAVTDLKYHMVWITKYRYHVLRGDVAERARELITTCNRLATDDRHRPAVQYRGIRRIRPRGVGPPLGGSARVAGSDSGSVAGA